MLFFYFCGQGGGGLGEVGGKAQFCNFVGGGGGGGGHWVRWGEGGLD